MRYLIDGYNFLFRVLKKNQCLEKSRQAFIQELNEEFAILNLEATLVFDGDQNVFFHAIRGHFDTIEIVYTPEHQTADEYILEEITRVKHPQTLTIVSNDRELKTKSQHLQALTLSIDQFLFFIRKKKAQKTRKKWRATSQTRDSQKEIDRLLKIFEEKLKKSEDF